jgi:hypothetical protein
MGKKYGMGRKHTRIIIKRPTKNKINLNKLRTSTKKRAKIDHDAAAAKKSSNRMDSDATSATASVLQQAPDESKAT